MKAHDKNMQNLKSSFLQEVTERGFVFQATDLSGLDELMVNNSVVAYIGFDATADSLHVGSLVQIMQLYWLEKHGHKPIVLMGGGTTKIGDPSGKDESRKLMTGADIARNISSISTVFRNTLSADVPIVDNDEWLSTLEYITFLRDYGAHFSVNRMLTFDSVKIRLEREHNLSFLEFNYMILQAYDFLELNRRHGCVLQLGGADQWGNIINGIELGRRVDGKQLFGLTAPLITTASGGKMGKTAQGAIWLNADRLSPYDYWQFWRNTDDKDVGRFLRLFTTLPMDEIRRLESLEGSDINEAKKVLADEATAFIHGIDAAKDAHMTAQKLFEAQGGNLAESDLPSVDFSLSKFQESGIPAIEILVSLGLAASKSEARRLIKGGGARINDQSFSDENLILTQSHVGDNSTIKLSAGKKRHGLLKLV